MPGHCKPILYGRLEASQPHLPALKKKTKTEEGVTDLQNRFVIKFKKNFTIKVPLQALTTLVAMASERKHFGTKLYKQFVNVATSADKKLIAQQGFLI